MNVAVTLRAWLIVTTQLPAPVQAPLQPVKIAPLAAVATSVTLVPLATLALQFAPQSMVPAGFEATEPVPDPALLTVSGKVGGGSKVAVTVLAWLMVNVQPAVPEQAPLHPAKMELPAGVAASVTEVPST